MKKGDKIKFLSNNAEYEINEVGVQTPKPLPLDTLEAGEVGYIIASIKKISEVKIGDTVTLAREDRRGAPARVQGAPAHGLRRILSFRGHQPRRAARGDREADPERLLADLRARIVPGPGHRLPLRVSGPAAQGDRPGAPGTGVFPVHRHHRPLGALPHHLEQERDLRDRVAGRSCPTRSTTRRSKNRTSRPSSSPPTNSWATS